MYSESCTPIASWLASVLSMSLAVATRVRSISSALGGVSPKLSTIFSSASRTGSTGASFFTTAPKICSPGSWPMSGKANTCAARPFSTSSLCSRPVGTWPRMKPAKPIASESSCRLEGTW